MKLYFLALVSFHIGFFLTYVLVEVAKRFGVELL
jgi:hypothetical protein